MSKDNNVKTTKHQKACLSSLLFINLFKYCVENKFAVPCNIKVEKEKIIAIEAPIIHEIVNDRVDKLSCRITTST